MWQADTSLCTHLELHGDVVDVATILVVVARIQPNERHGTLERIPALVKSMSSGLFASNYSLDLLLDCRQGHWFFDELVVVL